MMSIGRAFLVAHVLVVGFVVVMSSPIGAGAHEIRPAYLELAERTRADWEMLWKLPAKGEDLRLALDVRLPDGCDDVVAPRAQRTADSYVERRSVRCRDGLSGRRIEIDGLRSTPADVLARVTTADGVSRTVRLTPVEPSFVVQASSSPGAVALLYTRLGVEHILLGCDHLLFVLALMLLVRGTHSLVATITAFAAAHSITLAAASLGVVHVPPAPVEAVIALSIAFVAAEIVRGGSASANAAPALQAARGPWRIAFGFGLLHGLGFAGALGEVGLPPNAIPVALLFFNLGVEIGQLGFIAVVSAALLAARGIARSFEADAVLTPRAMRISACSIGGVAMYWTIQRVAAF